MHLQSLFRPIFAFKHTISRNFAGYATVALETIWLHEPRDLIFLGPLMTLVCLSRYSRSDQIVMLRSNAPVGTLVRRSVVSFLGQFPSFGPHLAPNCHLWLQVVVNLRPRPHPGQRFRRTGQTRWGYSHMSLKAMVERGLSTLACENWNRRRARKKPAVASQCGHPLHPDSRIDLSCRVGLDERVMPTICATPLTLIKVTRKS